MEIDGHLSNKPKFFVNDPEKLYRQRKREAQTNVAHELARQAMIRKENCIGDDDPLSFITQLLANDVTIFDQ